VAGLLLQFGKSVLVSRDVFELAELPEPESDDNPFLLDLLNYSVRRFRHRE
jgi:hypothetical protein